MKIQVTLLAMFASMIVGPEGAIGQDSTGIKRAGRVQRVVFERSVANVEYEIGSLSKERAPSIGGVPPMTGEAWFGFIPRRMPAESIHDRGHFIPFVAEYVLGQPVRVWCDTNLNGELGDDLPLQMWAVQGRQDARAFLADFQWKARSAAGEIPVSWKIRVIVEPAVGGGDPPRYRLQAVHSMLGDVVLEGKRHKAFLFDGNADGMYTDDYGDGLFIDLEDDRHFEVDLLSPAFGPLGAPFQIGPRIYTVDSVDPEGRSLKLRSSRASRPPELARVGAEAPDFEFSDGAGRRVRLRDFKGRPVVVYFWASWCGVCDRQAAPLETLYEANRDAGLEILGVSFDTDRAAMTAFREKYAQTWPSAFSGRKFMEDPVGRLYQPRLAGVFYLVDEQGILEGIYPEAKDLANQLEKRKTHARIGSQSL